MGKLFRKNSPSKGSHPPRKESSTMHLDDGGLRFELSKLFLGQKFAHGAFSKIYHGIYNEEAVAVKMVREDDYDEDGAAPKGSSIGGVLAAHLEKLYDSEVNLLSRLHHPNVVKFVGACRQYPVYCVVTEYVDQGSLRGYLHNLECKSLPLEKVVAMALDIARGMEYIHSQGVIHRDLKPENVLLDKDFRLKIADFGIACEEAYCDPFANEPAGTYRWMAPEVIKRKPYGRKVDVYSFGLILWELVAGTFPFEELTPIQAAVAVAHKNLRPLIPKDCPSAMRALIEQCWSLQPHKRPEFSHIVKVLEQLQSSLARDSKPTCQYDHHKKGMLQWINQKLGHQHSNPSPTCQHDHQKKGMHKPKFFRECRLVF